MQLEFATYFFLSAVLQYGSGSTVAIHVQSVSFSYKHQVPSTAHRIASVVCTPPIICLRSSDYLTNTKQQRGSCCDFCRQRQNLKERLIQAFSASNGNPLTSCFRGWLSSPTSNSQSCFTFVLQATEDSKERLEAAHNHTIGRLSKAVEDKFRLKFSPPVLAAVAKLSLNYIEEAAVDIEAFSRFEFMKDL